MCKIDSHVLGLKLNTLESRFSAWQTIHEADCVKMASAATKPTCGEAAMTLAALHCEPALSSPILIDRRLFRPANTWQLVLTQSNTVLKGHHRL